RVGDAQGGRKFHGTRPGARIQHDVLGHVKGFETAVLGVFCQCCHRARVSAVYARIVREAELHTATLPQHKTAIAFWASSTPATAGYPGRMLDIAAGNGVTGAIADLEVVIGHDGCRAPPCRRGGRHLVYPGLRQVTFLVVAACPSDAARHPWPP